MSTKRMFHTLFAGALLATGCLFTTSASLFAQSTDTKVVTVVGEAAPKEPGVLITSARPDSPAAKAGLRRGDIVLSVDGEAVNSADELRAKISSKKAGETVSLSVLHGDETRELTVTLAPRDDTGVLGVTAEQDSDANVVFYNAQPALPGQGTLSIQPEQPFNLPVPPAMGTVSTTLQLQIVEVSPDTPAAEAGLKAGEIIVDLNNEPLKRPESLSEQVAQSKPGDKVTLTIKSSPAVSETQEVEITLGERKDQPGKGYLGIRVAPMFMFESESVNPDSHFMLRTDVMTDALAVPAEVIPAEGGVSVEVSRAQVGAPPLFSMAQGMICMPAPASAVMAPGQPLPGQPMAIPALPTYFFQQNVDGGVSISGSVQTPDVLQFEKAVPALPSDEI
ncbi:MAG: PDZ domain-containing protein [Caldilineaceae bacterium]